MINPRKPIAIVASLTFAMLVLGASVASAHTVRFDSKLNAHFTEQPGPPDLVTNAGHDYFSGRISSPKLACAAFRPLRVFYVQPGPDPGAPRTLSDADGFWRFNSEDPPNGRYYARAPRKALKKTSAHTHVCKRARSQDFVVAGQP